MPEGRAARALGVDDFARLLGVAARDLPAACRTLVRDADFGYEVLTGTARDAALLGALRALASELPAAGPARLDAWEQGWSDVLARFEASGCDPRELWPHYLRAEPRVVRLEGEYVLPASPAFEASFVRVVQAWYAGTFLRDVPTVYEFGCGPGHNLVAFAGLDPTRPYVGLDWATASQRILRRVAAALDLPIVGRRFDMRAPDPALAMPAGAGVVTFGSLEQLGADFEAFLAWLLGARPAVCVHLEPIAELYDPERLLDHVAARYHEKRGYLRGYLTRLEALAAAGRVEIVHVKKHLGSFHHDGWVSLVWRPRPDGGDAGSA